MEPNTVVQQPLFHPQIVITHPETQQKSILRLSKLAIEVKVLGSLAATTLDVTFYNDHDQILEGELILPLNEGQTITRYALDIDGKMREGVVVEKEKARKVFEEIVRRQVDPGLVEKVQGNLFKTRVYPLPAKGSRRIRLGFEQALTHTPDGLRYDLPLEFTDPLDEFRLRMDVFHPDQAPAIPGENWANLAFAEQEGDFFAERDFANYSANKPLTVLFPKDPTTPEVSVEVGKDGHTYFHIHCLPERMSIPRKTPTHIGLYWDVSGSAGKRDYPMEFAMMDAWFKEIENFRIDLIPFSHELHEAQEFHVQNGNWSELKEAIKKLVYDGGTQLGALDLTQFTGDEVMIFTDGLQNYGEGKIQTGDAPVMMINSATTAHHAHMRGIAEASGGHYLNLSRMNIDDAVARLRNLPYRFLYAEAEGIEEVYPSRPVAIDKEFALAGILKGDSQRITLHFGVENTPIWSTTYTLKKPSRPDHNSGLVEMMWAGMKLHDLESAPEPDRDAIVAHGKAHRLVTDHTSLLVLEEVLDYVIHEIDPPEELREAVEKIQKERWQQRKTSEQERIESVVGWFNNLEKWWNTDYPLPKRKRTQKKGTGTAPVPPDSLSPEEALKIAEQTLLDINIDAMPSQEEPEPERERGLLGRIADSVTNRLSRRSNEREFTFGEEDFLLREEAMHLSDMPLSAAESRIYPQLAEDYDEKYMEEPDAKPGSEGMAGTTEASIKIKNWVPDEPYMKVLTEAHDPYVAYLNLKAEYGQSPAFFLDVADFFLNKNDNRGIRILSNISELKLGSERLLRLLAYKLLQMGYPAPAVKALEEVTRLKGEEPQSWRDYAMALARCGRNQEALENYYKVVTGDWNERFPRIQLIAVEEMNALIATCGENLDLSGIDSRLVKNLPVDLRVELSWDADNCDLDLWVTDPKGEKCFYSNRMTQLGGRMSHDFTQGYGPEIFMLKKAPKGKYKIEVDYYSDSQQNLAGPTSLIVRFYTQYAQREEKLKEVVLRVKKVEDVIKVGSFNV